jgi:hypothetical protein
MLILIQVILQYYRIGQDNTFIPQAWMGLGYFGLGRRVGVRAVGIVRSNAGSVAGCNWHLCNFSRYGTFFLTDKTTL